MVVGVGVDIVEIERIEKSSARGSFDSSVFTDAELSQAKGEAKKLAGDFSVKEAAAKALGTGFRGFGPRDIEVRRDELGKPYVKLCGGARERARELGVARIEVSITDDDVYAIAFAVAVTN